MPILSSFYGIDIKMYFRRDEHDPPHVHAYYSGKAASINIYTGKVIAGMLPPKALSLVREWILINQDELIHTWECQEFRKIKPLE